MSLESINAMSQSQTYMSQTSRGASRSDDSAPAASATDNASQDTITLSDEARRYAVDPNADVSKLRGAVYGNYAEEIEKANNGLGANGYSSIGDIMGKYGESRRQYLADKEAYDHARASESRTIMENLNKESGGLLHGTAFSDNLSKPITTTSGAPHPDAERIRSFLMNHQTELNQMKALREQSFPSFEEWQAAKA